MELEEVLSGFPYIFLEFIVNLHFQDIYDTEVYA